jgi:hypothetical protein
MIRQRGNDGVGADETARDAVRSAAGVLVVMSLDSRMLRSERSQSDHHDSEVTIIGAPTPVVSLDRPSIQVISCESAST